MGVNRWMAAGWAAIALATIALLAVAASAALAQVAPAAAPAAPTSVGIDPPLLAKPALWAVSLFRYIVLLVFAVAVAYVTHWTFRDTWFVNTNRLLWESVVLGGGLAGLALILFGPAFIPFFYIWLPLGVVVFAGAAIAYVTHRNALVEEPQTVLSQAHLARIKDRLASRKAKNEKGPVTAVGRDIVFLAMDDLPIRSEAADDMEAEANEAAEQVLYDAITRRASAVGFVSRPQQGEVRLRIDGQMVAGDRLERPLSEHFAAAVKRFAGLDPKEARKPQEGRLRAVVGGQTYELRIKTAGTVRGEQVAIRIIDLVAAQRRLEDLGMDEDALALLVAALDKRPGLVVLSSPRDSGLTATLRACLRHMDRYKNNVVAFESHPSVEIENVQYVPLPQKDAPMSAREVQKALGHPLVPGAISRQPDIIAIDALFLPEVAQVLADAARDHLVLVGLRAASTSQAITHLETLLASREPLAHRLHLVVNQRLVRLLCPKCKEAYRPNPEFLRKANLGNRRVDVLYRPSTRAAAASGKAALCPECHNDQYAGRTGLFEVMPIDPEAREMIRRGAPPQDLRAHARKLGMRNLQEEGLRLIIAGLTSVEEVLRAIKQET